MVARWAPVFSLMTVIWAPATPPPVISVIRPSTLAERDCGQAGNVSQANSNTNTRNRPGTIPFTLPSCRCGFVDTPVLNKGKVMLKQLSYRRYRRKDLLRQQAQAVFHLDVQGSEIRKDFRR